MSAGSRTLDINNFTPWQSLDVNLTAWMHFYWLEARTWSRKNKL